MGNINVISRYSTLTNSEPSLELSFCSACLFNKSGQIVYSADYDGREDVLLRRLADKSYRIEREIYAKHPACDIWRQYLVFDAETALSMPERLSKEVIWWDVLTICEQTKQEYPAMLAVPRNSVQLHWREVLLDTERSDYESIHKTHFLGVDDDLRGVTYEVQTPLAQDLSIFRLCGDPRLLTFISDEFLAWIFTSVPSEGFLSVRQPILIRSRDRNGPGSD